MLGDGFSLRKKKLGLGWAMNNHSPCSMLGNQCTTLSSGADPKTPGVAFIWLDLPLEENSPTLLGLGLDLIPKHLPYPSAGACWPSTRIRKHHKEVLEVSPGARRTRMPPVGFFGYGGPPGAAPGRVPPARRLRPRAPYGSRALMPCGGDGKNRRSVSAGGRRSSAGWWQRSDGGGKSAAPDN